MNTLSHRPTASQTALLVGILLIAANLRTPITGLPPLLGPIRADFDVGMSPTQAASLSGMAQCPALALVAAVAGIFAGRNIQIGT